MSVQQFRAFQNTRANLFWAIKMSKGQLDDHGKLKLDHLMNKARKLWDNHLQSVENFLWNRALGNFVQLILDFIPTVVISYAYPYWQFPPLVRYWEVILCTWKEDFLFRVPLVTCHWDCCCLCLERDSTGIIFTSQGELFSINELYWLSKTLFG